MVDGGGDNEQTAWGVGEIAVTNPPAGHWFMYIYPDTPCMPARKRSLPWLGRAGSQFKALSSYFTLCCVFVLVLGSKIFEKSKKKAKPTQSKNAKKTRTA